RLSGDVRAVVERPLRYAGDVGLVVLADVGGVGARDRALVAHPGDRDRGVQASGERDADAFAEGECGQDLAHVLLLGLCLGLGLWFVFRGFETLASLAPQPP